MGEVGLEGWGRHAGKEGKRLEEGLRTGQGVVNAESHVFANVDGASVSKEGHVHDVRVGRRDSQVAKGTAEKTFTMSGVETRPMGDFSSEDALQRH